MNRARQTRPSKGPSSGDRARSRASTSNTRHVEPRGAPLEVRHVIDGMTHSDWTDDATDKAIETQGTVTTRPESETRFEVGMDGFLPKPFRPSELGELLDRLRDGASEVA